MERFIGKVDAVLIGRHGGQRKVPCSSARDAVAMHIMKRDGGGYGASEWANTVLLDEQGRQLASVSYNGRLWEPGVWTSSTREFSVE